MTRGPTTMTDRDLRYGIRHHRHQFLHQLFQVLLVGLTIGMTRTVVPVLAESDFGVPKNSYVLLSAFVVAFGFVKGAMNFVAGRLSERLGRQRVLLFGWLAALPIPLMIWHAPNWNWVVAAMVLLGVNQGLTWSMTQTAKLDLIRLEERGLTLGLNEFSGYVGVAMAGIITAYMASHFGARQGLLIFGLTVVVLALILTQLYIKDTRPWALAEAARHVTGAAQNFNPRYPTGISSTPSAGEIFAMMSWRDKRMMALSQAGLVEKFVDVLVWIFYPIYLYQQGLSLQNVSWIISFYAFTWGGSQLFTGKLSDSLGRHRLNVSGMWLCGLGVAAMVLGESVAWWSAFSAVTGFGMALLYPNLSAAVADISHPSWRGTAIGIYRFWRDVGYGIGALGLGYAAYISGQVQVVFWFVAVAMFTSGALLWWLGEETHPKLNLL